MSSINLEEEEEVPDGFQSSIAQDFSDFFKELHGYEPYPWQLRLICSVAATGRWPEELHAPTGAGKTTAIEIHVFLNGFAGLELVNCRIPRRLIMTINRRALVDDQYIHACNVKARMKKVTKAQPNGIVAKVWNGLARRFGLEDEALVSDDCRLETLSLRGGGQAETSNLSWRTNPTSTAIICATPDMLGSRILFRGYGTSRFARPIEAGLLAYDSIAVVDEAHLNRQLETTLRQVERIESMASLPLDISPLQVMSATATPAAASQADSHCISLRGSDYSDDCVLGKRMTLPKPLRLYTIDDFSKNDSISQIAEYCLQMNRETGGIIGCILNTVAAASKVAQQIEQRIGKEHKDELICIVGRMRPFDREKMMSSIVGASESNVRFVVGTQALEVGLDIDFSGLVTQLASGSAIAQRAGRVNRFAKRDSGPILVLMPNDIDEKNSAPYQTDDLVNAKEWLQRIEQEKNVEGLSPKLVASFDYCPPVALPKRAIFERLEWGDADYFSCSSEVLAPEVKTKDEGIANLDLWLRDEFNEESDVFIVVRRMHELGSDAIGAKFGIGVIERVLELVPPLSCEQFTTSVGEARQVFKDYLKGANSDDIVFLLRPDEAPRVWASEMGVHPGDTFVVDDTASLFLRDTVSKSGNDAKDDIYQKTFEGFYAEKSPHPVVLEIPAHVDGDIGQGVISSRVKQLDLYVAGLMQLSADSESEEETTQEMLESNIYNWIFSARNSQSNSNDATSALLLRNCEYICDYEESSDGRENSKKKLSGTLDCIGRGDEADAGYFIIYTPADVQGSGWWQGVSSSAVKPVALEAHLDAVSERAEDIAETLSLAEGLVSALASAGRLHDEGKRDCRFQTLLRLGSRKLANHDGDLAKGGFTSWVRAQEYRKNCGLKGWRHEQRSASIAWAGLNEGSEDKELVVRLVGTSHGRGRNAFEDSSSKLLPDNCDVDTSVKTAAAELFDEGIWEALIEKTNTRYGLWGVSYLEALLRAADAQVSAEGR